MIDPLLPAVLGNLCAVLGHVLAWRLREKHLTLLAVVGGLGFVLCMFSVNRHCTEMVESYKQWMNTLDCWSTGEPTVSVVLKSREAEAVKIWQAVRGIIAVTMVFALIEQYYFPAALLQRFRDLRWIERIVLALARWIKALLIVWGELFIGITALSVSYKILAPSNANILYGGFVLTWFVLTFMRPLCLRWARPFWQVLNEMRIRKP